MNIGYEDAYVNNIKMDELIITNESNPDKRWDDADVPRSEMEGLNQY